MIRLALFADIHGKFLLPFKLAHHYQQTTSKSIDLIVQCGDMGAFPDKGRMDKATLRHAARDRDELGFMDDFVHVKPPIAQFLDRLNLNMLCVRGNHEDHEFLDELERQSVQAAFPIDAYRRVWVLKTSEPFVLQKAGESLEILGIGRIGDTTVYADKGYDSAENWQHLKEHRLLDGIMRKAHRNRPLTEAQTKRNRYLSKTRYVVEQSFGTLHRKFRYAQAAYFGLIKVSAQSHLKAMCLNLLKAANRLSVPVCA